MEFPLFTAPKNTLDQQQKTLKNVGHGDAQIHQEDHCSTADHCRIVHRVVNIDTDGALPRHDNVHDGNVVRGILEGCRGEIFGRRHSRVFIEVAEAAGGVGYLRKVNNAFLLASKANACIQGGP